MRINFKIETSAYEGAITLLNQPLMSDEAINITQVDAYSSHGEFQLSPSINVTIVTKNEEGQQKPYLLIKFKDDDSVYLTQEMAGSEIGYTFNLDGIDKAISLKLSTEEKSKLHKTIIASLNAINGI